MSNVENPITDALNLVQSTTVRSFLSIFTQTVSSEDGFSLELFRKGTHLGSILSGQAQQAAQMKQHFQALGARDGDTLYRINLGPRMQLIQDRLRTYDGYTREYEVTVELQVHDSFQFIKLYRQGADPVNLVILGIKEALQEYGDRTIYEKMHPANIQTQAKFAFDRDPGNLRAGILIYRTYQPSLRGDKNYQPINLSPLLTAKGQLTTLEGYVRDYEVTIELQITDSQQYKYLESTGAAPMDLAKIAIDGELERYARQEFYETLSELQLHNIVEHAFDKLPSRITGGLKIVRAHRFSLGADPDYINLGHRTLTLTGTLATADHYARDYEMTVELEIDKPQQFVRLTRQGNDPLNLVRVAIEGAIHLAADGKTHNELPSVDLHQTAHNAFTNAPDSTIGGLKIVKAHKVSLRVDPRIQEQAEIEHETIIEKTRVQKQAELVDLENELDFKSAKQVEDQEIILDQKRQEKTKAQYLFELEKDSVEEAHRLRKALSQWAYSQWVERAGEALQANVPVQSIVEEMSTLSRALQSGLPQISEPPVNKQLPAWNVTGGPNPAQDGQLPEETAQPGQGDFQIVEVPSPPKRNKINKSEWGLILVEVRLAANLRDLLDEQERAFQVWEVTEGGLAQVAGFQETDILIKINGQYVYTNEAFVAAFGSLQPGEQVKILLLREETRKVLTLTHPKTKEQDLENAPGQ